MEKKAAPQSLIPWLDPESSRIYLKIPLRTNDPDPLEQIRCPFQQLETGSPLSRILNACLCAGPGGRLKDVFLVMQRDSSLLDADQSTPFANKDVDELWQRAISFYREETRGPCVTMTCRDEVPVPFRPLFYCKARRIFFHPPCPRCGDPLEECHDDDLLVAAGLASYSTSLKRYLYCPRCRPPEGQPVFFVRDLTDGDPSFLKDCRGLIHEFADLAVAGGRTDLPCLSCPDLKKCYGPGWRAEKRITPFSFYNFHMFLFEASSIQAPDFLALVSGAPVEELRDGAYQSQECAKPPLIKAMQSARVSTGLPFLFTGGPVRFPEVLYLKLSFLRQMTEVVFPDRDSEKTRDFEINLGQFWVKTADYDGGLPFFWNFKVKPLDIGISFFDRSRLLKKPGSPLLHSFALTWFYVLLANKKQRPADIYNSLTPLVNDHIGEGRSAFIKMIEEKQPPFMGPGNIFWQPDPVEDPDHLALWRRALVLGWELFRRCFNDGLLPVDFSIELNRLADEVKRAVFEASAPERTEPDRSTEDAAIHDILTGIMAKWRTALDRETGSGPPGDVLEEEIAPAPAAAGEESPAPSLSAESADHDEDLDKTVILDLNKINVPPPVPDPEREGPVKPVNGEVAGPAVQEDDNEPVDEEEQLSETVIINPEQLAKLKKGLEKGET